MVRKIFVIGMTAGLLLMPLGMVDLQGSHAVAAEMKDSGDTAASPASNKPAAKPLFVAKKGSDKYHLKTCQYAKNIPAASKVTFTNAAEAEKAGYKPCKVCNPDKKR